MKALQFIIGTLFFAALGFYGMLTAPPEPLTSASGDSTDLTFTAADGSNVDLAKLHGKVVLLDFWATWCGPCRGEVPNVVAAYNRYHAQGFEVVGISLDEDRATMTQFTAEKRNAMAAIFRRPGLEQRPRPPLRHPVDSADVACSTAMAGSSPRTAAITSTARSPNSWPRLNWCPIESVSPDNLRPLQVAFSAGG